MLDELLSNVKLMEWNVASSFRTEKYLYTSLHKMILACFTLILYALKTQYDKFDLIISIFCLLKYWS